MSRGEKLLTDGIVPTPVETLRKLAAEGKFVSMPLYLPINIHLHDWEIRLDGNKVTQWVSEAYAPGMPPCGWVVMYVDRDPDKTFTGETEVKYGDVEIIDLGRIENKED